MKKLPLLNLKHIIKHYTNSIISYLSRILYTYLFTLFTDKINLIFFVVYFTVVIQSFFINSKVIFKVKFSSKKFFSFILLNSLVSFIEYFIFTQLLNVGYSILFSTGLIGIFTGLIRFLLYKYLVFSKYE
jgi:site-specific DNA-adenine methylase